MPKNAPAEIIDKLNQEINAGRTVPKIEARLVDLGEMVIAGRPAILASLTADETEKWAKAIKSAGIKAE